VLHVLPDAVLSSYTDSVTMTADMTDTIWVYQRRVARMPHIPCLGLSRATTGSNSVVTTALLLYLFTSVSNAIQFLKDLHLLPSEMWGRPVTPRCGGVFSPTGAMDTAGYVVKLLMPSAVFNTSPVLQTAISCCFT
jgi:hypothetical protein